MSTAFRRFDAEAFRWAEVERLAYKEEGSAPFKAISRQVLFEHPELACELRYFEMAAGGYSTLERHRHVHAVLILRGQGRALVGSEVRRVGPNDLVTIAPLTWHQFRADSAGPMGFLCMVNAVRDRPVLPDARELAALRAIPAVRAFLDSGLPSP